MDALIRDDAPDLSGGVRFVDSDRHKAYVEIQAFKNYIEKLRVRMNWPRLKPGFFDAIRAVQVAS